MLSIIIKLVLEILLFSFSLNCFPDCNECYDDDGSEKDMKCTSCFNNSYMIYDTSNCVLPDEYKNYYLNKTDLNLYPCSLFVNDNCYECDPYLDNEGLCLSCAQGYKFNEDKNTCEQCEDNEYSIIKASFSECRGTYSVYCDLYTTSCNNSENGEIICPDEVPFFDNITKSCYEYECPNNDLDKGYCFVSNQKYKDRILFVNWFSDNNNKHINYPSYNVDNSGYLLIEFSYDVIIYKFNKYDLEPYKKRKLYFYNEEGRGIFDEINDKYEKIIKYYKEFVRFYSTSMALKVNNSEKYEYFLNFETYNFNIEFFDFKAQEIYNDKLTDIFRYTQCAYLFTSITSSIQLLELNEKNHYLAAQYAYCESGEYLEPGISINIFSINPLEDKNVNIYSFNSIHFQYMFYDAINLDSKFYIIQNKNGDLILSLIRYNYFIFIHNIYHKKLYILDRTDQSFFHKLLMFILFCLYIKNQSFNVGGG